MSKLSDDQKQEFKELGFLSIHDAIDEELVTEAREALLPGIPEDREEYEQLMDDPEAFKQRQQQIRSPEPFQKLNAALFEYAEELVGEGELELPGDGTQIALRYPQQESATEPTAQQPSDLHGHIDGYGTGYQLGDQIDYASIIAVVYLDRVRPRGGGFTVWPGSHLTAAEYFEDHPLEGGRGGMPAVSESGWEYDRKHHNQFDPHEVTGDAGTVTLVHYKLEHTGGVNLSQSVRLAALRRFRRADADEDKRDAASNIWKYWPAMEDVPIREKYQRTPVTESKSDFQIEDVVEHRE